MWDDALKIKNLLPEDQANTLISIGINVPEQVSNQFVNDQAFLLMQFRSSKATSSLLAKLSSALRNQTLGS